MSEKWVKFLFLFQLLFLLVSCANFGGKPSALRGDLTNLGNSIYFEENAGHVLYFDAEDYVAYEFSISGIQSRPILKSLEPGKKIVYRGRDAKDKTAHLTRMTPSISDGTELTTSGCLEGFRCYIYGDRLVVSYDGRGQAYEVAHFEGDMFSERSNISNVVSSQGIVDLASKMIIKYFNEGDAERERSVISYMGNRNDYEYIYKTTNAKRHKDLLLAKLRARVDWVGHYRAFELSSAESDLQKSITICLDTGTCKALRERSYRHLADWINVNEDDTEKENIVSSLVPDFRYDKVYHLLRSDSARARLAKHALMQLRGLGNPEASLEAFRISSDKSDYLNTIATCGSRLLGCEERQAIYSEMLSEFEKNGDFKFAKMANIAALSENEKVDLEYSIIKKIGLNKVFELTINGEVCGNNGIEKHQELGGIIGIKGIATNLCVNYKIIPRTLKGMALSHGDYRVNVEVQTKYLVKTSMAWVSNTTERIKKTTFEVQLGKKNSWSSEGYEELGAVVTSSKARILILEGKNEIVKSYFTGQIINMEIDG